MRPSTPFIRAAGIAILSTIISAAPALSQTATTDPAGFITVDAQGNSDSYTFIPFKRTPEYAGAVLTPGGVAGNVVTMAGTPNFTANGFVYAGAAQPKTYYVLFTSGPKLGMYYTVTANGTNTLTLDPAGDDISGVSGATLNVIPYDTLGSIFPGGQGVNGSPDHSTRVSEVLISNTSSVGTNLAAAKTYYYFTGASGPGPGWRKLGSLADRNIAVNDDILYPDVPFRIRNNSGVATSLTYMGTVHMGSLSTPLGNLSPTSDQDNAVSLPIASDLTLSQTKLFESGAFVGNSSHTDLKDQLLVWDNTIAGKNKAAAVTYYYFTGTNPGWRKVGGLADRNIVVNSTVAFSSEKSVVVRKKANGIASTVIWEVRPPYVPATTP